MVSVNSYYTSCNGNPNPYPNANINLSVFFVTVCTCAVYWHFFMPHFSLPTTKAQLAYYC